MQQKLIVSVSLKWVALGKAFTLPPLEARFTPNHHETSEQNPRNKDQRQQDSKSCQQIPERRLKIKEGGWVTSEIYGSCCPIVQPGWRGFGSIFIKSWAQCFFSSTHHVSSAVLLKSAISEWFKLYKNTNLTFELCRPLWMNQLLFNGRKNTKRLQLFQKAQIILRNKTVFTSDCDKISCF